MGIAIGFSIASCIWKLLTISALTLILALTRKLILRVSSRSLLKTVTMIIMLAAILPLHFTRIPLAPLQQVFENSGSLQSTITYRIDYAVTDIIAKNVPVRFTPFFITVAIVAFLTVAALFCIRDYKKYYFVQRLVQHAKIKPDKRMKRIAAKTRKQMGVKGRATIIQHNSIPFPAMSGFIHPVFYIPEDDWTDEELKDLFAHEYAHFRHVDSFLKLLFLVLKNLNWWMIPMHWLYKCFDQACEYHCDFNVNRGRKKKDRLHYAWTVTKAADRNKEKLNQNFKAVPGMSFLALPNNDKFNLERFEYFVPKAPRTKSKVLSALVVVLTLLLSSVSFAYIPYDNDGPAVEVITGDYGYLVDRQNGSFDFYIDGVFKENIVGTRAEAELCCPPKLIFDEVPDLETVINISEDIGR